MLSRDSWLQPNTIKTTCTGICAHNYTFPNCSKNYQLFMSPVCHRMVDATVRTLDFAIYSSDSLPLWLCLVTPPPSVWPHLFWGAGHEKRRREQLKWSLAFMLYIIRFPCAQLPGPVHTARLGRACFFCIFGLVLCFACLFVLLGRLPKVDLIILEGEKCPSVRTSVHKKFLRFEWNLVYR